MFVNLHSFYKYLYYVFVSRSTCLYFCFCFVASSLDRLYAYTIAATSERNHQNIYKYVVRKKNVSLMTVKHVYTERALDEN